MEGGDYEPEPHWKGHGNFADARAHYDINAGRSYERAKVVEKKKALDLVEPKLVSASRRQVILVIDQTGSMGKRTGIIVSKLPYLEYEGQEYLGKDLDICFMAIGDATNHEDYPLQVRPFAKGADMKKRADELVIEAHGGGSMHETYELAALYLARNLETPNAIEPPIVIFNGDEMPYDMVSADLAKRYAGITLGRSIPTVDMFKELKRKCSVYMNVASYNDEKTRDDAMSSNTQKVYKAWVALLGEDHVGYLPDPERVVDVIFGIFAKETGRMGYFEQELAGRQRPDQVAVVHKSLKTIHAATVSSDDDNDTDDDDDEDGKSVLIHWDKLGS